MSPSGGVGEWEKDYTMAAIMTGSNNRNNKTDLSGTRKANNKLAVLP